jgi:phosphocarrier protein HPr
MIKTTITISNKLGLHARASGKLIKTASRFGSEITLQYGEIRGDAKSIMDMMMLGAKHGDTVTLFVEGDDEQQASDEVVKLFHDKFGEEE